MFKRIGRHSLQRRRRTRRGAALFIVMMFVVVSAALALTAIVTTGNASLVAKSYARENDLKYAAEAALAIGKSRLNFDASVLPDTSFVVLMSDASLMSADDQVIPGVKVTVYAGPSGSSSGQFGRFASVVAEARDNQGNGFIRRLELTQESFAKYAYWSDKETSGSGTIYFGSGDQLWGPVYSNDVISIASSGATFHDEVGTTKTISGKSNGSFRKGYKEHQTAIKLPNTSDLSAKLSGFASAAGWNFASPNSGSTVNVSMRIEFVAIDMNLDGDSTDADEGFFKIYTANGTGTSTWTRSDWPGLTPLPSSMRLCGDYHYGKFFPAIVHDNDWFETLLDTLGMSATAADNERNASAETIMNKAGTRCFLGGANQLAPAGRTAALGYGTAARQKGGDDTTFSATDHYGSWRLNTDSIADTVKVLMQARRPHDWRYLYPIHRSMNSSAKGVIYVPGSVGVSGTVRGRITLYATGTIVILDDIRYASDPVGGVCNDILGLLAGEDVVVADNAVLTPQRVKWSGTDVIKNVDDTKDLYLHAVVMALNTSFTVEDYNSGPDNVNDCEGTNNGRGCLYLTGGLIQKERGPVGLLGGEGYSKRYSYDRCAIVTPPPYFPTTGRFTDNRYYELNPVGFNARELYKRITPSP